MKKFEKNLSLSRGVSTELNTISTHVIVGTTTIKPFDA